MIAVLPEHMFLLVLVGVAAGWLVGWAVARHGELGRTDAALQMLIDEAQAEVDRLDDDTPFGDISCSSTCWCHTP